MNDRSVRILAAKKAAKTRRLNSASMRYYEEFTRPAQEKSDKLTNFLIAGHPATIKVEYRGDRRLKGGALYGDLIGVKNRMWLVRPFGYANPQWFHPKFWEPILR